MGRYHHKAGFTAEQQHAQWVRAKVSAAARRDLTWDEEEEMFICNKCGNQYRSLHDFEENHSCDSNEEGEYGTFTLEDFIQHRIPTTKLEKEYARKPIKELCGITREKPTRVVTTTWVAVERVAEASRDIEAAIETYQNKPKVSYCGIAAGLNKPVGSDITFGGNDYGTDTISLRDQKKVIATENTTETIQVVENVKMEMSDHLRKSVDQIMAIQAFDPKDQRSYDRIKGTNKMRNDLSVKVKGGTGRHTGASTVTSLIAFTAKLAKTQGFTMSVIGSKRSKNHLMFKKRDGRKYLKVLTKHENNKYHRTDITTCEFFDYALSCMKTSITHGKVNQQNIKEGWSGFILDRNKVRCLSGLYKHRPYLIVSGRNDAKRLLDARDEVDLEKRECIKYYSDEFRNRFWKSFESTFIKLRKSKTHDCIRDVPVEKYGQAVALFTQMLTPLFKTTCKACINETASRDKDEIYTDASRQSVGEMYDEICMDPDFAHYRNVFEMITGIERVSESSMLSFSRTNEIVMLAQTSQVRQIKELNEIIIKRHKITSVEFDKASEIILELARWFKNRQDTIRTGSLQTFRNKISAKTHINMALFCDNQLNVNGVFQWGDRGYHAKRIFSNFFNEISESTDYDTYSIRKHVRGKRHLAIKNLMVSTDLEKMRASMQGFEEERFPLGDHCVVKIDGNFVYSCCCVTLDDGKPLESRIRMPTKHHLVLGNNLDEKVVKLPERATTNMYIAKDGYCYLIIFLAALINVQESDAKDYTQMVRDKVVKTLGQWPSAKDVATMLAFVRAFYPEIETAELPKILIDHKHKTMHVMDAFGSMSTQYHILKANTVNQFIQFAYNDMSGELRDYAVGGDVYSVSYPSDDEFVDAEVHTVEAVDMQDLTDISDELHMDEFAEQIVCFKELMGAIFNKEKFRDLLIKNPCYIIFSLMSPTVLARMFRIGSFDFAIDTVMEGNPNLLDMIIELKCLAQNMRVYDTVLLQAHAIAMSCPNLLAHVLSRKHSPRVTQVAHALLSTMAYAGESNKRLYENGFSTNIDISSCIKKEELLVRIWDESFRELCLLEVWRVHCALSGYCVRAVVGKSQRVARCLRSGSVEFLKGRSGSARSLIGKTTQAGGELITSSYKSVINKAMVCVYNRMYSIFADIFKVLNLLVLLSILLQVYHICVQICRERVKCMDELQHRKNADNCVTLTMLHSDLTRKKGELPTEEEFLTHVEEKEPNLRYYAEYLLADVKFQYKKKNENDLEKIVATIALIMMIFDTDRSDAVFKILNKVKTVFSTFGERVQFQSLENGDSEADKGLVVDFDITENYKPEPATFDVTFEDYWRMQMNTNRLCEHYRTTGTFIEFSRDKTEEVVSEITSCVKSNDFLVRGPVGSGKSTGLPAALSVKGKVLILEPTRPLTENVARHLSGAPFFQSVTLCMRGVNIFGSGNITVMTTGYALHYFANNRARLKEYSFIMLDECHVLDASAMAFYCLCREMEYKGKIIKASATPPGRETEISSSQKQIKLYIESKLSFDDFVNAQGTSSNACMISKSSNILVYVASYNEVDQLSTLLSNKGFKVTKVDGRTMKFGNVEIVTQGVKGSPHFIVATNIIENGITIDIDGVVDFGQKVIAELDSDLRMMHYNKVNISFGERVQRLGRVGRLKAGVALRIGHTERGLQEVPKSVATEAALLCFAYGLPIMPQNVVVSALSKCTSQQARTMHCFELPPLFTMELVKEDGSMHPEIRNKMAKFKLRDCEIKLCKSSLPNASVGRWFDAKEYKKFGARVQLHDDVKIPFLINGIPDKLYDEIWAVCCCFKDDLKPVRLTTACAQKIAYTLQIDSTSIARTIGIIDHLISEEKIKQAHFRAAFSDTVSSSSFTIAGITKYLRSRYMHDYSDENLEKLQRTRAQILEFRNLSIPSDDIDLIRNYDGLRTVQFQNKEEIIKALDLKGTYKISKALHDGLICTAVFIGGLVMLGRTFYFCMTDTVQFQGKRERQKLQFQKARTDKIDREVFRDENQDSNFGKLYLKKNESKGKAGKSGTKARKFIHMYGFDPQEYSIVKYLDPLTGNVYDETEFKSVWELTDKVFEDRMADDDLERELLRYRPNIKAYYFKHGSHKAMQVDLTPHDPFKIGRISGRQIGFPAHAGEFRQTGEAKEMDLTDIDTKVTRLVVDFENKSSCRGLRNYSPIARVVCGLKLSSDGEVNTQYGIGFGSYMIANQHLFKRNNGTLEIKSAHGTFTIANSTQIQVIPIAERDLIIMKLPKDCPPFPTKLNFRMPDDKERVCLVGAEYTGKTVYTSVSESSYTYPEKGTHFWKYWVSTRNGQCGLPVVSTKDGAIVGIHSLCHMDKEENFYTSFPSDFDATLVELCDREWNRNWKFNIDNIAWGSMKIIRDKPGSMFRTLKEVSNVETLVGMQSHDEIEYSWLTKHLDGNLKHLGYVPGNLVTKHIVKGRCPLFSLYLKENEEAREYFAPLMGHYDKSALNKAAYIRDVCKYSSSIPIGEVDHSTFELAVGNVIEVLKDGGITECDYITDELTIIQDLNMNAAVEALYQGKKKDYLKDFETSDFERIVFESCERLYQGKMGVWNGSLKAEIRPVEKVIQNKTRSFTAAPIETLLGGKVCVDDFNNAFYKAHLKIPSTVGITKFYKGWDTLLRKLPEGWIYCDADGSQFDSSLTPYLLNAVITIREEFMEEWDVGKQMLRNLYTEIVYTPIAAPDGSLIKKFKGNNGGQPSTVVDNTLMVMLAMQYSLLKCGIEFDRQNEFIIYFCNGDDLIIAVEPSKAYILDSFEVYFKQLGLSYDFGNRVTEIEGLSFMSHAGKKVEDVYVPKLDKERIVAILEWDRSVEPVSRLEAIVAAMVESWGYDDLISEIRKFYTWVLEQAPYKQLAEEGKAPYLADTALRRLYLDVQATDEELEKYHTYYMSLNEPDIIQRVSFQSGEELDAARQIPSKNKQQLVPTNSDKDVESSSTGKFIIPKFKGMSSKMKFPKFKNSVAFNPDHLLIYAPDYLDLSNTRSTQQQFDNWYERVMQAYDSDEEGMKLILNGLIVWCIENGTSMNPQGTWVMMDGNTQIEYPISPLLENAQPTFRQIMMHTSDLAEAYIEMRNRTERYMPRYGLQRNLRDYSAARIAFDFYAVKSSTSTKLREAHIQMKAAAVKGMSNHLFGLDAKIGSDEEDTERHTSTDVRRNMHSMQGARFM
ncbi:polyprotein [Narcissus degeneration virus]|uniref:Genome polyprotein n=11 Tax=Narcissus degeneration virus TaxID=394036 RepID=A2AWV7_9POTV|nr:polyprotein [Narcissus degeneration virus]CAJ57715.1 polyprotein [Narcissus degeneration virus]